MSLAASNEIAVTARESPWEADRATRHCMVGVVRRCLHVRGDEGEIQ